MAIFKEFMHCVNTPFHSQIYIFFSLQMKCQILTFINSLKITYIPIILLLTVWREIHISENREKITVQRLKYQGVK